MALWKRTVVDPELVPLVAKGRVLASAQSAHGQVLGLVDRLVYLSATGPAELAWHQIERGGWDPKTSNLFWSTQNGVTRRLELSEPGDLPPLFSERVAASIAYVHPITLQNGRPAAIAARRDLGRPNSPLDWRIVPGQGVSAKSAREDPQALAELTRLRAEYDVG